MVQEIIWTARARRDLRRIHEYIAADSVRYAQAQIESIQAAAFKLSEFPSLGRRMPEFSELPYREIISGNYRVIYRFDEQRGRILIMTVVHGRQSLTGLPE